MPLEQARPVAEQLGYDKQRELIDDLGSERGLGKAGSGKDGNIAARSGLFAGNDRCDIGIGFTSGCMRGSEKTFSIPASRAVLPGQVIQENITVSSSLRIIAVCRELTLPSGTSSPQHSTRLSAPCSLKTTVAASACLR